MAHSDNLKLSHFIGMAILRKVNWVVGLLGVIQTLGIIVFCITAGNVGCLSEYYGLMKMCYDFKIKDHSQSIHPCRLTGWQTP